MISRRARARRPRGADIDAAIQLELAFLRSGKAPQVTAGDVNRLCKLLWGRGWQSALMLARALGVRGNAEQKKRVVRAIAENSDGAILSFPGSSGCKLFDEASDEEVSHCDNAFSSQITRMSERREAYRNRRLKNILNPPPLPVSGRLRPASEAGFTLLREDARPAPGAEAAPTLFSEVRESPRPASDR